MPDDDDEPPDLHMRTSKEFSSIMLRLIVDEGAKIERQAAETGKSVDVSLVLGPDMTGRVLLRIKLHCEPGRPATYSIEYGDEL